MNNTSAEPSVEEILRPYRAEAIAAATGRSRSTASGWCSGRGLPEVAVLPVLAKFLRMDLDKLTRLVASDAIARKSQVA